ncbi:Retroelement pol polyprotein-like [Rhynchospora pubera]|uniref:Retroelement pol polyprotein-like n=1 Tax=Rhynchospora pubera TaxID=906938 RepID=A0AAV8D0A4_9POAL|nr:Retroelement pol polyprotein-like [Rhynchospora pubera]
MAKDDNKTDDTATKKVIDSTSPFYLSSSENPGTMISSCVLKGDNYDLWEKAMKNALRAKNKLGFVNGSIIKPAAGPEANLWESCNSMLVSWLFNSIDSTLQPSIAYMETAKELWDDLRERFSIGNGPRIHQLKADIAAAKQQGQSVVSYYTRLKGMWDELSSYSRVPVCKCKGCTCNAAAEFVKEREEEKIHQFLMGLDDSVFGTVRSSILGMEPLPTLNKVYSMVIQEERHRSVARGREERGEAVGFAVQAVGFLDSQGGPKPAKVGLVDRPSCTHCGKMGHEVSRCYELIGYPEGWGRGGRTGRGGRGGGRGARGRGHVHANAVQGSFNAGASYSAGASCGASAGASHGAEKKHEPQVSIPGLSDVQMQQIMAILTNSNASASYSAGASTEKLHGKSLNLNWILDSGASHHMTGNYECLQSVHDIAPSSVGLPNGTQTMAKHEGQVVLQGTLTLRKVLYVPTLNCNLISLSKLISDNDCFVVFTNELCVIQDRNMRMPIGVGELRDGVYYYHPLAPTQVFHTSKETTYELWHRRMGHPSSQITCLFPGVKGGSDMKTGVCDICMCSKQSRIAFPVSLNKTSEPFELIHCDIWGAYRVASHCGAHYFLTIVDDFTRAVWVYLMAEKSEVAGLIQSFCKMVQTQFCKTVKCVRSDNGTEFKSGLMLKFYAANGILHQTSCVRTPQQNGRVERKHRHILNVARALRFQSNLPLEFWGECILTAAFLINRTPTPLLQNKTPYEMLFGKQPSYAAVRIFGCLCYTHKSGISDKFDSRSRKCVFIGYPFGKKGWRVYDLETKKFVVTRDVVFCENEFPFKQVRGSTPGHGSPAVLSELDYAVDQNTGALGTNAPDESAGASEDSASELSAGASGQNAAELSAGASGQNAPELSAGASGQEAPGHSAPASNLTGRVPRSRKPPAHLQDYMCYTAFCDPSKAHPTTVDSSGSLYPIAHYLNYNKFSVAHRIFLNAVTAGREPQHFGEAVKDVNWRNAMQAEIDALERNRTWTVEDLPPTKTAIGCKWVYRIKYNSDGSIERYKARLVVLGNRQIEGIDYTETFAPVAKMVSVRTFLAVAIAKGWELHQMDVHNAFLHGDLNEEVYMRLPPGFNSSQPGKVCRLRKSLYGLRQAPRMWFSKLSAALLFYGFVQSKADYSLFSYTKGDVFLAILVYVDDLVIAGNNSEALKGFKQYLSSTFHMKDLGALKYFLGIEITRGPEGLFLCQRKYTLDILAESGLLGAKPAAFPIEQNHQLLNAIGPPMDDPERYRRIVGRLIYLTITRPELCYSVHVLAQFMQAPLQAHYDAAIRVLRYLKGNPGQGVVLRADSDLRLYAYCDSDWASCPLTRRSLTGYFVMLGQSPISWKTKKQHTVSRSSAEAEYRSMATTACELTWLKSLLQFLGVSHTQPMKLFCDSQAAIHIASNPVFHERTKHIEVDCHYVRDSIRAGHITTSHVRTTEQLADIFTKALGKRQFQYLLSKLGIRDLHAPT